MHSNVQRENSVEQYRFVHVFSMKCTVLCTFIHEPSMRKSWKCVTNIRVLSEMLKRSLCNNLSQIRFDTTQLSNVSPVFSREISKVYGKLLRYCNVCSNHLTRKQCVTTQFVYQFVHETANNTTTNSVLDVVLM